MEASRSVANDLSIWSTVRNPFQTIRSFFYLYLYENFGIPPDEFSSSQEIKEKAELIYKKNYLAQIENIFSSNFFTFLDIFDVKNLESSNVDKSVSELQHESIKVKLYRFESIVDLTKPYQINRIWKPRKKSSKGLIRGSFISNPFSARMIESILSNPEYRITYSDKTIHDWAINEQLNGDSEYN